MTKEELMTNELRALSWKQPYATMMLFGKVETRRWNTKYRGLVLICTSKVAYTEYQMQGISGELQTQRILVMLNQSAIKEPKGMAIAVGRLVDCIPMQPCDVHATMVKYYPDLFCHIYKDVVPIYPFEWKGSQGWRRVPDEIKSRIEFQNAA